MAFSSFDPNSLVLDRKTAGGEKYLATWKWPRDGDFSALWHAANSAVNESSAYFLARESINSDVDLSDSGKKSRLEAVAKNRLAEIGRAQKSLNQATEDIATQGRALAAVRPYGAGPEAAAMAVLDAEIARALRELPTEQRDKIARGLLSGQDPRVTEAVLRLPSFVTGISENMRVHIEAAAIRREHPEAVKKQEQLSDAARGAQAVLRGAAAQLLDHSGLDLQAQLAALGGDWRGILRGPGDAMDALARKYATPAEAAA